MFTISSTRSSWERRVVRFKFWGQGTRRTAIEVRPESSQSVARIMRPCAPEQLGSLYSGPHEAAGRVGSRSISDSHRGRVGFYLFGSAMAADGRNKCSDLRLHSAASFLNSSRCGHVNIISDPSALKENVASGMVFSQSGRIFVGSVRRSGSFFLTYEIAQRRGLRRFEIRPNTRRRMASRVKEP